MSSPAETSQQQPNPSHHTGFDPVEFWYLHKMKIIALSALFIIALLGYSIFALVQKNTRESANRAFTAAKTADDFRKVIAEYPTQTAAGNARLELAALLRKEGKFDEANQILRDFIEKNPTHPLIAGAWLGLGQNAEAAGKTDEALTQYQKILTTFPTSYAAPIALLAQGRIQKAKGQTDAAKRSFEQVISQYQMTSFQFEAQRELGNLSKAGATPETKLEAKPEPAPEVKPEAKPDAKPEAKPETKPETAPEAKPEAKPEGKPEAKPEPKPEN